MLIGKTDMILGALTKVLNVWILTIRSPLREPYLLCSLPPSLTSLSEMSSEAIDSSTLNLDDSSLSKMTIRSPLRGPYLRQCPQSHMSVFPISTSGA